MIHLLLSTLALFGADHHETVDTGCGYSTEGTIEEQFDRCLSGTWGYEENCTEGGDVTHAGFTNSSGAFCPIDYLIRDPHTAGFRIGYQCPGEDRQTTVLLVEDGVVSAGDQVAGFQPAAWRCTPSTSDQ
jgi:hypothetical protein